MNNLILADRIASVRPSPTLALDAKVKKMQASGGDIINLGVGEPDFDTPDFIKEAAIIALREGKTKYTPVTGILPLREAICEKFKRDNSLSYGPDDILVSTGAKQSLYNAFQALINPGDEVIIPCPYWVSYPDMVRLANGHPVFIETSAEQAFKMSADQLRQALSPHTKMLVLNSPSNPSGMIYSKEELLSFAKVLADFPKVIILSDDIYEPINWANEPFHNILNVAPFLWDRTVVVNGLSKAYAMTGWRLGYAAGPKAVIDAMTTVQSQSTSNANSITQYAAVTALRGDQSFITEMVKVFKKRHDLVHAGLNRLPGVKCLASQGAFYSFPDITIALSHVDGGLSDDIALADYLLSQGGVAVVPGSAFGTPGCLRISFATSDTLLEDALERLYTLFTR